MRSSSFFASLALVRLSVAGYALLDDYQVSNFFDEFDFFTDSDPTHGFVTYVDQGTAQSSGLIKTSDTVHIGVDSTNVASGGRQSVRITSKKSYNEGLIILDLAHMPGSVCGTWPAFWTVGPNWPLSGEIDIIEGVNSQAGNQMTLHTDPGCTISANNAGLFSGNAVTTNCDVNAAGQATNAGCGIATSDTTSYGSGFNAAGGGVYAVEWTTSGIAIWHFSRANIPSDIANGSPNPSNWGTPTSRFGGGSCDFGAKFKNQQIVFDVTFCGDWAAAVWGSDATCSAKASSCTDFVANNPSAFSESYWEINSLRVYSGSADASSAKSPVAAEPQSAQQQSAVVAAASSSSSSSSPSPVAVAAPTSATPSAPAAPAAPQSSEVLQFGWFGQGSNGIDLQHAAENNKPVSKQKPKPKPTTTHTTTTKTTTTPAAAPPPPPSPSPPAAAAATPEVLQFGWFGQGSNGIPAARPRPRSGGAGGEEANATAEEEKREVAHDGGFAKKHLRAHRRFARAHAHKRV